ncbi:MAG TPA: YerC/YecD family TrpR-related protein [Candidatus Saccharimonadales bacterium]|nr:YerC/YecD family TrpR-related protein [Candidatus Saccharimonadales bacterium]
MQTSAASVWDTATARQLAEVIAAIADVATTQNFLRDVMTEKEIIAISSRFEAARLLQAGNTYTEIVEKTRLSSRTVARISDWMQNGCGGYNVAIEIARAHHSHIPPARA